MIGAKNYETVSKFVKVMTKILWPLFFPDTVYILANILTFCNQRLYMLCQLKRQGLPLNCLNLVFDSLICLGSRLMYASPSSSGYLNVECVSIIQKLFTKHRPPPKGSAKKSAQPV